MNPDYGEAGGQEAWDTHGLLTQTAKTRLSEHTTETVAHPTPFPW